MDLDSRIKNRISELVNQLNDYAYQYYVLDEPIIADAEYDKLYDELIELERSSGVVMDESPTKRIGGEPIKSFGQHTHLSKLYSLDKCNSYDELEEWCAKNKAIFGDIEFSLEYKFDGLTMCLTYNNGALVRATTRGNGEVGEDVTSQIKTIKSVPLRINYQGLVEVQGECIMRWKDFFEYNSTAEIQLKNPRNGASGAVRNLDPRITATRKLDILFYNVNYIEKELPNQQAIFDFLKENRFKTEKLLITRDIEEIIRSINLVERDKLEFCIDGMVIKIMDVSARNSLGATTKFPRWAIAYKFEAEEATTKLLDVIWQVGRTGKITPLAILEPVELNGATVKRATLNNYGDLSRKQIRQGCTVFLRRSHDVIPEILGALDEGGELIPLPTNCPSCFSTLSEIGANLFCTNSDDCPTQICGKLEHFVAKDCMDIEGISEKTIEQLYYVLGVKSALSLYSLTENDLLKLDNFKDKKVSNYFASLEKSKSVDLAHFIHALAIPNIGKKTAKDLSKCFGSIAAVRAATRDELLAIPEIGEIMADSLLNYLAKNGELIDGFVGIGINPTAEVIEKNLSNIEMSNKKFVITGTLSKPRDDFAKIIEQAGGEISSAVSKNTDYLLAGENAGSKLTKAQKLNVKIISENDLNRMLNT